MRTGGQGQWLKAWVIVACLGAASVPCGAAQTDIKLGFVNVQRLLTEAPQSQRAKKRIERDFEKRDQELTRLSKQLQSMQESFEKNGTHLGAAERAKKERELSDLNRDFQRKQREFREDLSLRQNEELAAISDLINKAIKRVAEAERYDLIVQDAVFANPRIDITDRIIKMLEGGN
jgi:outer membrane protein